MEGIESGDTGRNLEMITDNEEEEASDCEASLNDSTFEGSDCENERCRDIDEPYQKLQH